jgi:transposase InsO family protein
MASENPLWGTERIRGELLKLGLVVSARSIRRYRRPPRNRPPSPSWRSFLANELQGTWAADLFVVQTLTFKTLYVLFFIAHARRKLVHVNVTEHPTVAWVWQQLLNATPPGCQLRYLLHDRDGVYGADFSDRTARLGIRSVRTPVMAPNANAIAERIVRTIRTECSITCSWSMSAICTPCWPSSPPTTIATGRIAASASKLLSQGQDYVGDGWCAARS